MKLITIPSFAHQLFAWAAMPGGAAKLPPLPGRVRCGNAPVTAHPRGEVASRTARSRRLLRGECYMAKETPPFTWTGWGLTQAADYATAASTYLQKLKQAGDLQDRALAHAEFVKMQMVHAGILDAGGRQNRARKGASKHVLARHRPDTDRRFRAKADLTTGRAQLFEVREPGDASGVPRDVRRCWTRGTPACMA